MPRLNPSICTPRALFIDLSGTIHIEDKVVPQSIEAINALKQSNVPHLFVTNTSKVCKGYQNVLFLNGGLKNHFMYTSFLFDTGIYNSSSYTSIPAWIRHQERKNIFFPKCSESSGGRASVKSPFNTGRCRKRGNEKC